MRVRFPGGKISKTDRLAAWNRKENWALLIVPTEAVPILESASDGAFSIGDRCYSMGTPAPDTRVMRDCRIVGRLVLDDVGIRVNVELPIEDAMVGTPILNDYGDVIAMATIGDTIPGLNLSVADLPLRPANLPYASMHQSLGARVGPLLGSPASAPVTFQELHDRGEFMDVLVRNEHLARGTLTQAVDTSNRERPRAVDDVFEIEPGTISVLLTWNPLAKIKTKLNVRVYDVDNQLLFESHTVELELKTYDMAYGILELDTSRLSPGVYRVDAVLPDGPCWRSFFRIVS